MYLTRKLQLLHNIVKLSLLSVITMNISCITLHEYVFSKFDGKLISHQELILINQTDTY